MRFFIAVLFILIKTTIGIGQDSTVRAYASLDTNVMLIGDKNVVHFNVTYGDADRVVSITPKMPLDTAVFEITKDEDWDSRSRTPQLSRDIAFIVWDSGLYRIPAIQFVVQHSSGYTSTVETPPLLLTVNNPKGVDEMASPMGIKEIIREEWGWEDAMPWIIGLVVIVGLGAAIWFMYKKMKEKQVAPVIQKVVQPPHIIALKLLNDLKNKQLWQNGQVKEYYSELSHILRGYLEERYYLLALETTTDELIAEMQNSTNPSLREVDRLDLVVENLQDLLQTADLVKFAKVEPPTNVHEKCWMDAVDIVEKTKPKPVVVVDGD